MVILLEHIEQSRSIINHERILNLKVRTKISASRKCTLYNLWSCKYLIISTFILEGYFSIYILQERCSFTSVSKGDTTYQIQ